MQEVPPSPDTPPSSNHRLRFYVSLILLLLVVSLLTWLTVALIVAEQWFWGLIAAYPAILIIIFSPRFLRRLSSRARIAELICEFDQISDRFVRPKAYRHKSLSFRPSTKIEPKSFIYRLYVGSDGEIKMPVMTDRPGSSSYNVSICINDDLVLIRNDDWRNGTRWLVSFFEKHSGKGQKIAHLRIAGAAIQSGVVAGDFTVEGDEFDAFMKTIELAKHFTITPNFQP